MCNFGGYRTDLSPLLLQRSLGLLCQWRQPWRSEPVLCKSICHPLLWQNSNFFHHISDHLFFSPLFVASFCYLSELIWFHKRGYVHRLYGHFTLDNVKNEIWLNVWIWWIGLKGFYSYLWPLSSCYSGMELWRQLALKMKRLGEMQWKSNPAVNNVLAVSGKDANCSKRWVLSHGHIRVLCD